MLKTSGPDRGNLERRVFRFYVSGWSPVDQPLRKSRRNSGLEIGIEVSMFGADQKIRGLWGREWIVL